MFLFLGRKKPEEIPAYLALCNAAFISFADNPLFEMTIPAKMQSYMACGMPILAVASGETQKIIEQARCGKCITARIPEKFNQMIKECLEEENLKIWGNNAMEYCIGEFDKQTLLNRFETIQL